MDSIELAGIGMTSLRTRERLVKRLSEQGITNPDVLDVMRTTPRHIFIDEALSHRAYEDSSLPIGFSQTISRPYIVARMSELIISRGPRANVLEVGTGSGYQTAVLARLVGYVSSIERIRPLQDKARKRLSLLKLRNINLRHSDGYMGWKEKAPFDAILSAAAPEEVPEVLLEQLSVGGILVIPVGEQEKQQKLHLITRTEDGYDTEIIEDVYFVPLRSGVRTY